MMSNDQLAFSYIGGPTALLEWGALRLLTDPTFDPAGAAYPTGAYTLRKAVAALVRARHPWSRPPALLWNIVGLTDLVMAVTLGVLSSPGPFHLLALDHPNMMISAYPFVLIPTIGVPLSILLHLFSLRGLRQVRSPSARSNPRLRLMPRSIRSVTF